MAGDRRIFLVLTPMGAASALRCRYPPLLDLPVHLFAAKLLAQARRLREACRISLLPVPDSLWQAVLACLCVFLPPPLATLLLLCYLGHLAAFAAASLALTPRCRHESLRAPLQARRSAPSLCAAAVLC